jgi:hypothetical protein
MSLLKAENGIISLPGGKVRVFAPPPPGFDPFKSSDRQLSVHGLPPRPQDPFARDAWDKAMSTLPRFVEPVFSLAAEPPIPFSPRPDDQKESFVNPVSIHWAGMSSTSVPPDDDVSLISAEWTIPPMGPSLGCSSGPYNMWVFIGIDSEPFVANNGLGGLIQLGCACSFVEERLTITPFWSSRLIANHPFSAVDFPIQRGDTLSALICINADTHDRVLLSIHNKTTNEGFVFNFMPDPGFVLKGHASQCVLQANVQNRAVGGPVQGPIPRFEELSFQSINAPSLLSRGASILSVNHTLVDVNDLPVAVTESISPSQFKILYRGLRG